MLLASYTFQTRPREALVDLETPTSILNRENFQGEVAGRQNIKCTVSASVFHW